MFPTHSSKLRIDRLRTVRPCSDGPGCEPVAVCGG